jgi:hypothetical protein
MTVRGALTIAGTVAGSAFGPVGAAIGGMIGGAIGGALEGPVHSSQAILEDLGALKLDYGSTWPRMYGRYRFKVSPIWSSDKRPIANDEEVDAKGGPSAVNTTYTYQQDWLTWAPLNAIGWSRIWRNGELIASRLSDADAETLEATASTTAWESVTFFDGAADQMPWSVYEAAVGTPNAVAYRRRPTQGFESLDLGNSGQAPLIEAEYYTNGGTGEANTRLQTNTAETGSAEDVAAYNLPYSINEDAPNVVSVTSSGFHITLADSSAVAGYVLYQSTVLAPDEDRGILIEGFIEHISSEHLSFFPMVTYVPDVGQGARLQIGTGGSPGWGRFETENFGDEWNGFPTPLGGRVHFAIQVTVEDGTHVYIAGQEVYSDGVNSSAFDSGLDVEGALYIGQINAVGGIEFRVTDVAVRFEEKYTANFTPPTELDPPDGFTADPQPVDLADIVRAEALLEWGGETGALTADDIDVSELVGIPVTGYATTGSPRESIANLMDTYYFQAVCSDKLYFRLRGGPSAATIPFTDTGAGVGDPAEPFCGLERGNDLEVALQVAFTAPGLLRDYEPDTQHSDRLVGESFELRRYQSPVVFEPMEAKGRADTMVYDARVAAHTASLSLDDAYIALEPTDVVTATDDEGNAYRVRIERETYADGVRGFDVVLDDPNVLLSSGITAETDQRAITIAGPADTDLILFDGPLLRPADDSPGHYAAVQGSGRWPGAVVYRAPAEAGTYARIVSVRTSAVAGVTTTELGDWTGGNVFDETNIVRVEVSGGTLSSSSRDDVIEDASVNAFAIGAHGRWEVIQATTAALVSAGVYDLSGLLRGRLGTEHAMGSHEVGDTVIKLQAAGIVSADGTAAEIGVTRYWKGVTVGQTLDAAEAQEFTHDAVRLKPLAPVDLRCSRDGTGGFSITAARRSRYESTLFATVPLGEATEAYEVDIIDGDDVVRTITASSMPIAYTATQQVADFGAVQAAIDVAVYQVSAVVGRGYPLLGTLSTSYTPATQSNTITLAGTFSSGVPISVYANGSLIGSRTSVGGDTTLAGVATGLAAVVNAHANYAASAVGSVITVTGNPGAVYTLTAIVGGSSAISAAKTQDAALASDGEAYEAQLWIANLSTGVTEPVPSGVTFTVTVKVGGFTVGSFDYLTTSSTTKVGVLSGLAGALADEPALADYAMNLDSTESGGYFGVLHGPVGTEGVSLTTTASAPWGLSVTVQNPGGGPVAEDTPQIVDVTVTGTPKNGEVFRVTVDGTPFTYTATVPTDTREEVIDGLVTAIDADADYTAAQTSGTKLQVTGAFIGEFSYSAGITRSITATIA